MHFLPSAVICRTHVMQQTNLGTHFGIQIFDLKTNIQIKYRILKCLTLQHFRLPNGLPVLMACLM